MGGSRCAGTCGDIYSWPMCHTDADCPANAARCCPDDPYGRFITGVWTFAGSDAGQPSVFLNLLRADKNTQMDADGDQRQHIGQELARSGIAQDHFRA